MAIVITSSTQRPFRFIIASPQTMSHIVSVFFVPIIPISLRIHKLPMPHSILPGAFDANGIISLLIEFSIITRLVFFSYSGYPHAASVRFASLDRSFVGAVYPSVLPSNYHLLRSIVSASYTLLMPFVVVTRATRAFPYHYVGSLHTFRVISLHTFTGR